MKNKETKYAFGLNYNRCFDDIFDTVEELIDFAIKKWDDGGCDYFDDEDDNLIKIGTVEFVTPSDIAPSLVDIAEDMTDIFYCNYNIDDDLEVQIRNRQEAEKKWKEFVEKYMLPGEIKNSCQFTKITVFVIYQKNMLLLIVMFVI